MDRRRSAVPGALCALCAVLAGCGSSAPATTSAAAPARSLGAARSSHSASEDTPVSKAQAIAYARTVNLTAADVPGASATPEKKSHGHERARCGFGGHEDQVAELQSPRLKRGTGLETEQIRTSVSVRSNAAAARRELAIIASAGGRTCVARALREEGLGKAPHLRTAGFNVLPLTVEAPGSSTTAGMRLVITYVVPGDGMRIPEYVDLIGFATGRAQIGLSTISATQPVPAAVERQLTLLLAQRAASHAL